MRLLWMHANEDPPPPVQVRGYDSPLDPVILRCLAKAREDRYDSAGALLAALRQIAGDAQAGALTRKRTTAGMLSATLFDPKGLAEVAADGPLVSCKTLPTVTDGKAPAGERAAQQSQAPDDLVRALRERGIGDPSLADHLAQKLRSEDAVLRVEAQIDLLSTLAEHHEVRTRERETRLRLALSQLEHEAHESSKGGDDDDAETLVGEREPSPHIAALARQLVELDSELKRLLAALQRQIDDMRAELDAARDAADAGRDALRAALRPLRQSGRSDAELMTLFLLAGV